MAAYIKNRNQLSYIDLASRYNLTVERIWRGYSTCAVCSSCNIQTLLGAICLSDLSLTNHSIVPCAPHLNKNTFHNSLSYHFSPWMKWIPSEIRTCTFFVLCVCFFFQLSCSVSFFVSSSLVFLNISGCFGLFCWASQECFFVFFCILYFHGVLHTPLIYGISSYLSVFIVSEIRCYRSVSVIYRTCGYLVMLIVRASQRNFVSCYNIPSPPPTHKPFWSILKQGKPSIFTFKWKKNPRPRRDAVT